ncbi:cytochrome c553 [Duganella sp. 3397]|uniref:hypothetical protein n=1 Tax=Duganella sp. 3397 TaxID=2817732 RepID=UPI0028666890|nr:hypothetical protein [Duganella sp. 3397]MDR7049413.1 cytochrome c553 [Duganella sp. 3397]
MTTISGSISPSVTFTTPVRAAVKSADQHPTVVAQPANLAVEQKVAFAREAASPVAPPSQANTPVVANDPGTPGAPSAKQPRGVYFATGKNEKYLAKPVVQTPEIKAEIARVRAEGNKAREEMEKFMESAGIPVPQKTQPTGPIYYILPQIDDLWLDGAENVMEMTKLLAESGKAVNTPVRGRYGEQEITDLTAYQAILTDYMGKLKSGEVKPAPIPLHPFWAQPATVSNDAAAPGTAPAVQPRGVYFATGKNEKYLAKPVVQTPEIKAEIARVRAEGNKAREEMEKFMESAGIPVPQKTQPTGPIYYILPQIEGLSQDGVKNVMEITKLLSESGKAVNTPVKGHYGDKEITDLAAYRELLTDYLGKIQTAKPNPAAAIIATLQAGNAAASSYRQVRDLLGQA